ncbi:hypothetical protein D3C71_2068960 [compost metagenome]
MPICRNRLAMPKVRASSATIGTTRGPNCGALSQAVSRRTAAMVVDISLPSACKAKLAVTSSGGTGIVGAWCLRAGNGPPRAWRRACR